MKEKTYTLSEIKAAYYAEFHEGGEMFFDYTGTSDENKQHTEQNFKDFVFEMDQAQSA